MRNLFVYFSLLFMVTTQSTTSDTTTTSSSISTSPITTTTTVISSPYGTATPSGYNRYSLHNLGFNITYNGIAYSQVSISTSGYVCLGSNSACSSSVRPLTCDMIVGLNFNLSTSRSGSGQIYFFFLPSGTSNFILAQSYANLLNSTFTATKIFQVSKK